MSTWQPQLDRLSRSFWRLRGRPVDLTGDERWLSAPLSTGSKVRNRWLEEAAAGVGGAVVERPDAGLLADMAQLDGPTFSASDLRPEVRDHAARAPSSRMRKGDAALLTDMVRAQESGRSGRGDNS